MDILADGPTKIVQCGFPRDDGPGFRRLPMRLFKRHGTNAWFLADCRIAARSADPAELRILTASLERMDITLRVGGHAFQQTVRQLR